MTTITANSGIGLTLASPGYYNPVVIATGVTIGGDDAIYAAGGTWSIQNSGELNGTVNGIALVGAVGDAISNAGKGVIQGASIGVYISGASASVTNSNVISATGSSSYAIDFAGGGAVTNAGTIRGGVGISIAGGTGTISNTGAIYASDDSGVVLSDGGDISQGTSGIISASIYGIVMSGASGSINNAGSIVGAQDGIIGAGFTDTVYNAGAIGSPSRVSATAGVYLKAGGDVINQADGSIRGWNGVLITGGTGTVVNDGLIRGAVALAGGGTLINRGTILGNVKAGQLGTVINSGLIQSGVFGMGAGSLTNLAGGTIGVGPGLEGIYFLGAGTVTNGGRILAPTFSAPAILFRSGYQNQLNLLPGATFYGAVNGGNPVGSSVASTVFLESGSSVGYAYGFTNFSSVVFGTDAAWVVDEDSSSLNNLTFSGFAATDTIQVLGFTATASHFSNGVLTLQDQGHGLVTLNFAGDVTGPDLIVAPEGTATIINFAANCFAAGTRIHTPGGLVPVERLRVGDTVELLYGDAAPVVWVGRRAVHCDRHPNPTLVWPVRVQASALGPRVPERDVFLSPDHAIYVHDVLVPVRHLINGSSIAQIPVAQVTYYHIELPAHAVVLADGLPAESYLDAGDRSNFANAEGKSRLFADFATPASNLAAVWEARGCAPLLVMGPHLEALRRRITQTAAEVAAA